MNTNEPAPVAAASAGDRAASDPVPPVGSEASIATDKITDRERLLISLAFEGPPCPYFAHVPLEGSHGPKTCNKGCWEEPGCDGFDAAWTLAREHPDLFEAVLISQAYEQNEHDDAVRDHPEHPLHDWLAERDPAYAVDLADWRATWAAAS